MVIEYWLCAYEKRAQSTEFIRFIPFLHFFFSGKTGCKRPVSMVYRNRSTEALAHSMTELAKSVLFRSGGHLASSFYIRDSETGNVKTPNHVLHMCALQLAMYGLGIANNASTAWESRSYSPHVAMLTSKLIYKRRLSCLAGPNFLRVLQVWLSISEHQH